VSNKETERTFHNFLFPAQNIRVIKLRVRGARDAVRMRMRNERKEITLENNRQMARNIRR
jgi:hypothetical protein